MFLVIQYVQMRSGIDFNTCPSDTSAAMYQDRGSTWVAGPSHIHRLQSLALIPTNFLSEVEHGRRRIRGTKVRPAGELHVSDLPYFVSLEKK